MALRALPVLLAAGLSVSPAADAAVDYAAVDFEPPAISIATGPRNPGAPMIVATATDNVGVVAMQLYLNDVLRASSTMGTISCDWAGVRPGTYRIRITATDAALNIATATAKIVVR